MVKRISICKPGHILPLFFDHLSNSRFSSMNYDLVQWVKASKFPSKGRESGRPRSGSIFVNSNHSCSQHSQFFHVHKAHHQNIFIVFDSWEELTGSHKRLRGDFFFFI